LQTGVEKFKVENCWLTTELDWVGAGKWMDKWMDGSKTGFKGLLSAVQKRQL
jgi:hypothetical protein